MNSLCTLDSGIGGLNSGIGTFVGSPKDLSLNNYMAIPLDADSSLLFHYPFNGDILNYNQITQNTSGQYFVSGVSDANTSSVNVALNTGNSIFTSGYSLSVSGGYLTTNTPNANINTNNGVTVSVWTYYNSANTANQIINFIFNSDYRLFLTKNSSNYIYFDSSYSTTLLGKTSTRTVSSNTWNHIVATLNTNSVGSIYINGVFDSSGTMYYRSTSNLTYGILLFNTNSRQYVNDLRFYNRALDAAEITQLYNLNVSPFDLNSDPSFCLYYTFDVSKNSLFNFAQNVYGTVDASFVNGAYANYTQSQIGTGSLYLPTYGYVNLNSSSIVNTTSFVSTNGMTFACWFYSINNANYARIFDFGNGNQGTNGIFMYIYNNSIGIGVKTDNTTLVQVDSNNYNDSTWYHVVWTMTYSAGNTSTWKAYIDASLSFTGTNNRYPQQVARSSCFLGRSNFVADPSYNGYIDDFRVYQRVLTQTEINTLYYYDNTLTANSAIFKWNVPNKRGGTLSYNYYFADNSLNFSEISNNTTSTNTVLTNQLNGNGIQYYVKAQIPPNKQSAYANISSNFTYINSPTNLTVSQGYSIPLTNANFSTPSTASYLYITSGLGQVVTGWTLSYLAPSSGAGGFIIGKSGSSPFDPSVNSISGESYIGAQTGFGGSTNNLSFYQTQYLTNDVYYSLSFYTSGTKDASYSSSTTLSVSISGQTTISNLVSNFVVSNINWSYLSYSFTVSTTASYDILFTIINNGGGDNTINVTDVSLVKINNASLSWTASQTNGTIDTYYGTYDSSSVVHIPLNTDSALVKYYPFFYNDTLNYASGVGVNDISLVNLALTTSVYKFGTTSLTQVNTSTQPYFTYPTIPTNTNKYTISFWFNLYQYGGVTHYLYGSPNISITYVPGAFNSLFVYLNSQATQLSSVSLNTWTHIALTVDTSNNTTGTAYVNNVATTTSTFTSFRFTDLSNVKVLQYNPIEAVPMSYMVDFRYYNRVLSSTDISSLYYYTGLSNYSNGNILNYNSTTAGISIPWGLSLNKFKVQGKLTNNLYSSPSSSVSFIVSAIQPPPPIQNLSLVSSTNNSFLISFTDPSNISNYVCTCMPISGTTIIFDLSSTTNVILGNTLTSATTYTISVSSKNENVLSSPVSITAMTLHNWAGINVNNSMSFSGTNFHSYNINNTEYVNRNTSTNINTDASFVIQSLNGVQMNSWNDPSFNSNSFTYATAYSFSSMRTYIQGGINNNFTFYVKSTPSNIGYDASGFRYFPIHISTTLPGAGVGGSRIFLNASTSTGSNTLTYSDNGTTTNIFNSVVPASAPLSLAFRNIINTFITISGGYVSGYVYDNSGTLLNSATSPTSRSGSSAATGIFYNYQTCGFGLASIYSYGSTMNILYFNVYQTALTTSQMINFSNNNTTPYL